MRESRALSPVSWRMALVVVHVRPGGREEHQQSDIPMLFGGMWGVLSLDASVDVYSRDQQC